MTSEVIKQPTKSILKHTHDHLSLNKYISTDDDLSINTSNNSNISNNITNQSWFSKLNSMNNNDNPATTNSPNRINSLFNSFRKQSQQQQQQQQQQLSEEDKLVNMELSPRAIRRVRFPVTDMTQEYLFKREDILVESKKQNRVEPVHIQTSGQLLSLYESVCRRKHEPTINLLVSTLISQPHATYLTRLDLTNQPIDKYSVSPFADIMSIGFGLQELILNNCGLEDDATKILMHSLLENDKIKYLSLAKNTKLGTLAFKYIAVYIKGSSQLSTLDLSYTQPNKKSLQYLLAAAVKPDTESTSPSLYNLILNGCGLRSQQLEVLAAGIRKPYSTIKQLSIRGNKILSQGALAIGVMLRDYDQTDVTYGLERLLLDDNDLSQGGIQYIAQALKRNQGLRHLSICECKIDSKDFILICEALKYNQYLERLDIGYNPLCSPSLEGVTLLKQALNINRSLKDLCLADTGLDTEATIALAECLSENHSLVRLDLSRNPKIQLAGLLAISASMKMNQTITFVDINIPTDDKDMIEIHNGIIAACTRNAQSKNAKVEPSVDHSLITTAQKTARLTLEERLAAVTKGKNIRPSVSNTTSNVKDTPKKDHVQNSEHAILIQQAFDKVSYLEDIVSGRNPAQDQNVLDTKDVLNQCKQLHSTICLKIPEISDTSQLDLLLAINDRLTVAIQSYEEKLKKDVPPVVTLEPVAKKNNENDELLQSFEIGDDDDDDDDDVLVDDDDEEEEERANSLKELRSEIEAEESAAFLKAKKAELEENDNENE